MKKKKKTKPRKKKTLLTYLMPEDLVNLVSQGVTHALDRHPGIMPRLNHGPDELLIGRHPIASIESGVRPRLKPKPLHILGALMIPVGLAILMHALMSLQAPEGALYRIRHTYKFGYSYSRTKPQLLQQECVYWMDMAGRGNIVSGRFEISEVPGRIPVARPAPAPAPAPVPGPAPKS
jgi:hypothetical protein